MVQRLDSEWKHTYIYIYIYTSMYLYSLIYLTNILWSVRQLAFLHEQSQFITSETSSMFLKTPPNIPQPRINQRHFESSRTYPTQNNHQESTINNYSLKNKLRRWFPSTGGEPAIQLRKKMVLSYLLQVLQINDHLVPVATSASHLNPEAGTASSLLVISIFGLGGRG